MNLKYYVVFAYDQSLGRETGLLWSEDRNRKPDAEFEMHGETDPGEKEPELFEKESKYLQVEANDSSDENMPVNPQVGSHGNFFEKD